MDVFNKPATVDEDIVKNLGPLTPLAGMWKGEGGIDISPSGTGPVETKFRERLTFEPMGPVVNGPQILYGLRYSTTAWPLGEKNPFMKRSDIGCGMPNPNKSGDALSSREA